MLTCLYAVRSRQLGGERCCSSDMSYGFLKEASRCRIETFGDVNFEHVLGPKGHPVEDGFNGIPTRTSGAKAIGMRRELRFPCGFQGLADDRLPCPVVLGWNPQWAFFATATLRYPRTSQ